MEQNIYQSPESDMSTPIKKRLKVGKVLSIIGAIFHLGIIFGWTIFVLRLYDTFQTITLHGGDDSHMAGALSSALAYLYLCMIISTPGIILNSIALFISYYRSKYLNIYLIIVSILWTLVFPFGTPFGLIFLAIVIFKWNSSNDKNDEHN
ncbi:hypothetical protein [Pleionea litopenaei]|uniref:DUF4064 domain-containing protein n=1 Tax=Pleionea litopenaei TaxID=3070815 RepID=A0AA51RQF4_9GAMM|nr:hypothetical protein [Pleionea sp. HL-JVS1]WMS85633.1 hypothetical protein Q9312_10450 [Pleionea sp. HL-JVS1]